MTSNTIDQAEIESQSRARSGPAGEAAPAWHPDPLRRFRMRYWDGSHWTARVVNAENQVGFDRGWPAATPPSVRRATNPQQPRPETVPAAVVPVALTSAVSSPSPTATVGAEVGNGLHRPAPQTARAVDTAPEEIQRAVVRSGVVASINKRKVATALVVLALLVSCVWGVLQYRSGNAWEDRAGLWESRAVQRADERDEAEASADRKDGRIEILQNRVEDRETRIEGLAADNAALGDEREMLSQVASLAPIVNSEMADCVLANADLTSAALDLTMSVSEFGRLLDEANAICNQAANDATALNQAVAALGI